MTFSSYRVTHYEQRLRTLHYKKKFTIWLNELRPKIQSVLEASKEVQRSKRLKRMLELILAFGNYMNRGQRGNAHGFKLNSLTRIADTKSSCNKNMTLLHFMAETCEEKVGVMELCLCWVDCQFKVIFVGVCEENYVIEAKDEILKLPLLVSVP